MGVIDHEAAKLMVFGLSEEILVYNQENMWTYEIKLTIGP